MVLTHTAVRDKTTGEFLLNGDERISSSKRFIASGTRFVYTKKGRGESLTVRGPLLAPIEIMVSDTCLFYKRVCAYVCMSVCSLKYPSVSR